MLRISQMEYTAIIYNYIFRNFIVFVQTALARTTNHSVTIILYQVTRHLSILCTFRLQAPFAKNST